MTEYIVDNEDFNSYEIPDKSKKYILINSDILRKLLKTKQNGIIKCYCLLLRYYKWHKNESYFTQKALLDAIGYSNQGGKNYQIIKDILNTLIELKLLKYHTDYKTNEFVSTNKINYMK